MRVRITQLYPATHLYIFNSGLRTYCDPLEKLTLRSSGFCSLFLPLASLKCSRGTDHGSAYPQLDTFLGTKRAYSRLQRLWARGNDLK